jgi:hypothetical protein
MRYSGRWLRRIYSSGMLPCVALRSTDVTADIVPGVLSLSTLMMEAIRSPETSVLTRDTLRHIPGDGIFNNLTCVIYHLRH